MGQTWAGPGQDEQEEDSDSAGLGIGEEVSLARPRQPRRTGEGGPEGLHNLSALADTPAGSQLGNTFPSLTARALIFQELLIRALGLLSLLGEEQAPPLKPAHEGLDVMPLQSVDLGLH